MMDTIPNPEECKVSGLKFYRRIPEGFRLATMDDVRKNRFRNNTPYLGKGTDGLFYCKRIKFTVPKGLIPFVESHRVYIYTGKNRTADSQEVKP